MSQPWIQSYFRKIFLSYNSVEDVDSASDDWIAYAPIVHIEDAFYIFKDPGLGGDKTIKKLDAGYKWSVVGDMITQSGRHNFNVIYNDNYVLIIGGEGRYPTEKCIWSNDQMNCTIPDPESVLSEYGYPGLFPVTSDFCKNHEIKDWVRVLQDLYSINKQVLSF